MNTLCANLSTLFTNFPLARRFEIAASCGFLSVEMQYPYELPAGEVLGRLNGFGQRVALINSPPGREPKRRGLAAVAGQQEAFRTTFLEGIAYAATINCNVMHVLSGVVDQRDRRAAEATWLANMAWAAELAADAEMTLVVEALNPIDVPGYFIQSLDHAVSLMQQLGGAPLQLLFDSYHCEMAGKDCIAELRRCFDHVGHVQIADCPGRAEPGTGSIDWRRFFEQLTELDYGGDVGLEFFNRQSIPQCFDAVRGFNLSTRAESQI